MNGKLRGSVVVPVVVAVAACGVASTAWALSRRGHDGSVPTYDSAQAMARSAGCAATFRPITAPAGVQSAGRCIVGGHVVAFRVQRVINTANPWPMPAGATRTPNYVGNGWIVHSSNVSALDAVGAQLAP